MANSKQSAAPSQRVRVKRLHERGHYDAETIHAILDAMPICSVGYVFNGATLCDADPTMAGGRSHVLARIFGEPHARDGG